MWFIFMDNLEVEKKHWFNLLKNTYNKGKYFKEEYFL